MKDWWTAAELAEAALSGLPTTKSAVIRVAKREGWADRVTVAGEPLARKRKGRGGGMEYHRSVLPERAQMALAKTALAAPADTAAPATPGSTAERVDWSWFESLPDSRKRKARERLKVLEEIEALKRGGMSKNNAVCAVANAHKVGKSAVYDWFRLVAGLDRADWLPALAPKHTGRTKTAGCDPRAWEFLRADYLRLSKPSFETCYQRLELAAAEHGWDIPAKRTLQRRLENEIPRPVQVLLREGYDALHRLYPPQERDRSMFHALEAVNADGHKWDVFVRWYDGSIVRPMMVAIQDLYSGAILGWRFDVSENADSVRLAFGDVFRKYGIPDRVWLDNGRGFASKWITGGTPNRYRFKVKPEEPAGVLTALGMEIHWTRPYSGQSKPIERAFRDLCDSIAKHPAFEGAYTGNSPAAKPENYGSKAVPVETFIETVEQGIRLHNTRPGRNTRVCRRKLSFEEAFRQSYGQSLIRKATPEQLRMCMLAAEKVRADRESGSIRLLGNRYWSEALVEHAGEALTVRFDPDHLHDGITVYRLDGQMIAEAACLEAAGFADTGQARDHNRKRNAFKRATKEAAEIERSLTLEEYARLLPDVDEPSAPEAPAIRLVANGSQAAAAAPAEEQDFDFDEAFARTMAQERRHLRLIDE
ncbi:MAG: hypothetical protein TEF_00390 [Rhizobiales bacterium NRL2]|jgi:transposase InsO family protein|nr:MAG: hypothetical protein TEF_00390 [Rhizobiales bacterium NRL2]